MNNSFSESYKAAGVDVTAGYEGVKLMKKDVERTRIPGVLTGIGGFGGLFEMDMTGIENPVLVSGTDGVGTKLMLAFLMDKHDTIGIDAVAMCVNDIICSGAKPLIFLDYIACGKNKPERVAEIVKGVADGCVLAGCALVGGETAEMPGFYDENEYDIAGYSTGVVDKSKIINNQNIKAGDIIVGIASSGVHSNGFSLVRKIFDITNKEVLEKHYDELGMTLGESLLTPTEIYVKTVLDIIEKVNVKAVSHITGGGYYENIPRSLPDGKSAKLDKKAYEIPAIFKLMQKTGNISERDMYNTFNMGIGMTLVVDKDDANKMIQIIAASDKKMYILGEVIDGDQGVVFVE